MFKLSLFSHIFDFYFMVFLSPGGQTVFETQRCEEIVSIENHNVDRSSPRALIPFESRIQVHVHFSLDFHPFSCSSVILSTNATVLRISLHVRELVKVRAEELRL
jgi:hypothetical protein